MTILFVNFWSCCCRDLWTNCLNNLLYALSYTWHLHLCSPAQTLPCWNLTRKVMPKLNLTHCCWLLCNEWHDQFSFPSRPKLGLLRTYTWDGFDKCEIYVEMMIKVNPCISMILNKQQKSYDRKNVQFLTLADSPVEHVCLEVSAEWVMDFLITQEYIYIYLFILKNKGYCA